MKDFSEISSDKMIFKGEHFSIIQDSFPVSPGHLLIVSNSLKRDYFELNKLEAFRFQISEVGYRSLRSYLRATIASEEPVGIVGNSRFCVARSSYHLFHHCHHYTAKGLREAGLPISMRGALTRDGFAKQLRRIMPLS